MNADVTLLTDEKKLAVVYGGDAIPCSYSEDDARHSLKYILCDMADLKQSFIRLGFHLYEFSHFAYYRSFGYRSMAEFCEANLGLSRSSYCRLINVYREFSMVQDCTHTMYLDEKYQDYSYSQLCEMLGMSDEQRRQVRPDMTVKEIRELKKNVSRNVSRVATSQQMNYLDFSRYESVNADIRKKMVRECDPVSDAAVFDIYDCDGNFVGGNVWCNLLAKKGDHYIFRLDWRIKSK